MESSLGEGCRGWPSGVERVKEGVEFGPPHAGPRYPEDGGTGNQEFEGLSVLVTVSRALASSSKGVIVALARLIRGPGEAMGVVVCLASSSGWLA